MPSRIQKIGVVIVLHLFLLFSLAPVKAQKNPVQPEMSAQDKSMASAQSEIFGRVRVRPGESVLVNSNPAFDGMTILAGTTLEIPLGSVADVKVGLVGSVYLAAETKATLAFNRSSIKVNLMRGCVGLNTTKEASGAISTPDGRVATSEVGRDSTLNICSQSDATSSATAQEDEKEMLEKEREAFKKACGDFICSGLFGLCKDSLKWIIPVSVGAVVIPIAIKRGRNPSPSSP